MPRKNIFRYESLTFDVEYNLQYYEITRKAKKITKGYLNAVRKGNELFNLVN